MSSGKHRYLRGQKSPDATLETHISSMMENRIKGSVSPLSTGLQKQHSGSLSLGLKTEAKAGGPVQLLQGMCCSILGHSQWERLSGDMTRNVK